MKIKIKNNQPRVSTKDTLNNIVEFVQWCMSNIENLDGFNVMVSKHPGKCYILAKQLNNPMPIQVLPVHMDYVNPVERPLIVNAINQGMTGMDAPPEILEAEMVSKADE